MANTGSPGRHIDWKRRERDAEVMEKVAHKYGCAEKAEQAALEKYLMQRQIIGSTTWDPATESWIATDPNNSTAAKAEEAEKNEKSLDFLMKVAKHGSVYEAENAAMRTLNHGLPLPIVANGIHHGVVSMRLSCKHIQNTYLRIYKSVLQLYICLCSTHMKNICNENNYLQGTDIGTAQGGNA